MFKKKSFIKIEFLPEGKPLVSAHIDGNTNAELVADFINKLIVREYLDPVLEVILRDSKKNKAIEVGEEICENVLSIQRDIEIRPIPRTRRTPIISPSDVMKQFERDESHE